MYGPEANDLVLQLRKRKIDRVILAGMSANLCVESHLRELLEQGFEVYVVKDATAGAKHPVLGDGYAAALTNFHYIANGVMNTTDTIEAMGADIIETEIAVDTNRREEGEETKDVSSMSSNGASSLAGGSVVAVVVFNMLL